MSRITYDTFIRHSNKMIENGFKVCPCCLSDKLEFMTDEDYTEYELRCKVCGVGIRDHVFSRINKSWNHRSSKDIRLHAITHNINCVWWDN